MNKDIIKAAAEALIEGFAFLALAALTYVFMAGMLAM